MLEMQESASLVAGTFDVHLSTFVTGAGQLVIESQIVLHIALSSLECKILNSPFLLWSRAEPRLVTLTPDFSSERLLRLCLWSLWIDTPL